MKEVIISFGFVNVKGLLDVKTIVELVEDSDNLADQIETLIRNHCANNMIIPVTNMRYAWTTLETIEKTFEEIWSKRNNVQS